VPVWQLGPVYPLIVKWSLSPTIPFFLAQCWLAMVVAQKYCIIWWFAKISFYVAVFFLVFSYVLRDEILKKAGQESLEDFIQLSIK
jgi:hypothetical protein